MLDEGIGQEKDFPSTFLGSIAGSMKLTTGRLTGKKVYKFYLIFNIMSTRASQEEKVNIPQSSEI